MIIGLETLAMWFDPWTYALVGIVALLLFGKRLPEVGRSLGKGIAEFKKGLHDVQDELNREEPKPEPPAQPRLRAPEADDEQSVRRRLAAEQGPNSVKPPASPAERVNEPSVGPVPEAKPSETRDDGDNDSAFPPT